MGRSPKIIKFVGPIEELKNEILVDIVRGSFAKNQKEAAYILLEERISSKIFYIIRQFFIPGLSDEDIKQEALFALRFKAIPDYTEKIGRNGEIYPFDKFAILCIRRHLSTILKESFQNKKKTLNTSLSLNQDRGLSCDEFLFLSEILPQTKGTVVDKIGTREDQIILFKKLMKELSKFEQQVFILYANKYSYREMSKVINRYYRNNNINKKVNIKSIDNSISRIKQKAQEIYYSQKKKEQEE